MTETRIELTDSIEISARSHSREEESPEESSSRIVSVDKPVENGQTRPGNTRRLTVFWVIILSISFSLTAMYAPVRARLSLGKTYVEHIFNGDPFALWSALDFAGSGSTDPESAIVFFTAAKAEAQKFGIQHNWRLACTLRDLAQAHYECAGNSLDRDSVFLEALQTAERLHGPRSIEVFSVLFDRATSADSNKAEGLSNSLAVASRVGYLERYLILALFPGDKRMKRLASAAEELCQKYGLIDERGISRSTGDLKGVMTPRLAPYSDVIIRMARSPIGEARVAEANGNFALAENLYLWEIKIRRSTLGSKHPYTASCLNEYAGFLRGLQRTPQALPLEREADSIVANLIAEEEKVARKLH